MRWFEAVLVANADTPVVVFTHAPPMGSGLKARASSQKLTGRMARAARLQADAIASRKWDP